MDGNLILEVFILFVLLIIARILFVVHKIATGHSKVAEKTRNRPASALICIGSGGHTSEMLKLIQQLNFETYSPRYYILAKSDTTSQHKIHELEEKFSNQNYFIRRIPRSRIVHQSYFTSIFTTIYSILKCIPLVCQIRPDLILCNGPGTCIPICLIAFILKVSFICDTRIVFIESFCRTKTFSLTGKILIYFADNILVQWPNLKRKLKRADYIGQLM